MNEEQTVQAKWNSGGENELVLDERIYPDRSCGQYDAGWIAFHRFNDKVDYFITTDGRVYLHGTSEQIGVVTKLKEQADRYDAELDALQEREQAETGGN